MIFTVNADPKIGDIANIKKLNEKKKWKL